MTVQAMTAQAVTVHAMTVSAMTGQAMIQCWYGSTPQPLLKVRNVGGVTVSRLQRMLTKAMTDIYDKVGRGGKEPPDKFL